MQLCYPKKGRIFILTTCLALWALSCDKGDTAQEQVSVSPYEGSIKLSQNIGRETVAKSLSISLDVENILSYAYKAGNTPLGCEQIDGYITISDIKKDITLDMESYEKGAVRLCIVGADLKGTWQPRSSALSVEWHNAYSESAESTKVGHRGGEGSGVTKGETTVVDARAHPQDTCEKLDGHWVFFSGDSDYKTQDFCVMQYEAINNNGVPGFVPGVKPWRVISAIGAKGACESLGSGYQLISNEQWMTIAAQLASNDANWSGNSVGQGVLRTGHTDGDPAEICPASTDVNMPYLEGSCDPKGQGGGEDEQDSQIRFHSLQNGKVIWDLSGNAWDLTSFVHKGRKPTPDKNTDFMQVNLENTGIKLEQIIPTAAIKSYWNDSWNNNQRIGMLRSGISNADSALRRGGDLDSDTLGRRRAGIFAGNMNTSPDEGFGNGSFRCSYVISAPQ